MLGMDSIYPVTRVLTAPIAGEYCNAVLIGPDPASNDSYTFTNPDASTVTVPLSAEIHPFRTDTALTSLASGFVARYLYI